MLIGGTWVENAVRFPVEKRSHPSLDVLAEVRPDYKVVAAVLEMLGRDPLDAGLKNEADDSTAEYLQKFGLGRGDQERKILIANFRESLIVEAVALCVEAKRFADEAYKAGTLARNAKEEKSPNFSGHLTRANKLLNQSAKTTVEAYRLSEVVFGKCRAIDAYLPRLSENATEWLIEAL